MLRLSPLPLLLTAVAVAFPVTAADAPKADPSSIAFLRPTTETREVSLDQLVRMAVENNLDIQFDRYAPEFAYNEVRVAEAGFEPVLNAGYTRDYSKAGGQGFNVNTGLPTLGSESDRDTLTGGLGGLLPYTGLRYNLAMAARQDDGVNAAGNFQNATGNLGVSMTQPLLRDLWIDQTRLNISQAHNRLQYSQFTLMQQVMTTITQVENAYYDLLFSRESVRVQEKALELAQRLLDENRKRVEVGALAPLDEKQAESQVAARKADLLNAQRAYLSAQNGLRRVITDDYSSVATTTFEPAEPLVPAAHVFDVQDSWRKGMELRPDLQQAKLDLERQGIILRYNKNQLYPQLDVIGSYGHGASGVTTKTWNDVFGQFAEGDLPNWRIGAAFSIPLGNSAARNRVKNSKISVEQQLLTVKQIEQNIMVQIDDAILMARKDFLRIDSTRQARQYAEAALEAEQKKLENGKSTSFIVLQLQRDFISARSEEIRALADYNKALAQLALQEGSTLERRNIDVRFE